MAFGVAKFANVAGVVPVRVPSQELLLPDLPSRLPTAFPFSSAATIGDRHLRITMKNQLSTLTTLHYVYGVLLCLVGLCLLGLVFAGSFLNSDWLQQRAGEPPPPFVGTFLSSLGWILFALVELHGVLNFISAANIQKRKGRTFSQVVAALNCLNIPFGLALGIYTFVVLGDREVQGLYDAQPWDPGGRIVR